MDSPKTFDRICTLNYLAVLHDNNQQKILRNFYIKGEGGHLDITWVECFKQGAFDLV